MFRIKMTVIVFLLMLTITAFPFQALATNSENELSGESSGPMVMTLDLVIARPLGFVAMLGGMVIFVVSVPFSALGGNTEEALDTLVTTPLEYTFKRPLGHFE